MLDAMTRLTPNMLGSRKGDSEITISVCALSKPDRGGQKVVEREGWPGRMREKEQIRQ